MDCSNGGSIALVQHIPYLFLGLEFNYLVYCPFYGRGLLSYCSVGGSLSVIRGYAPKTSKVGTRPSEPAVSLIALTAICSSMYLVTPCPFNSFVIML